MINCESKDQFDIKMKLINNIHVRIQDREICHRTFYALLIKFRIV